MCSLQSPPLPTSSHQGINHAADDVDRDGCGGGEVRIDIPDHGGPIPPRRRSRFDRSTRMMIEMTLAIGGQTIGAVALTSCGTTSSPSSWPLYSVELCIIFGMSFIFAAISLRSKLPVVSTVMAKVAAAAIALAIIISVTSHLPPVLAFTAGPFAFLLISVAVAFPSTT
ncbi:hypothetical protein C2S53_011318 [Perilla frutescens var. hirtella]|uniref:Uncharacterized protein n=1 Tax=Perilla frutescens var. hirtella TaxID=608512 RepID=A0AAD4IX58_PERFH|nr:hypothetical protein C2S53_011318 [Perilla frutescens var. hirtella]